MIADRYKIIKISVSLILLMCLPIQTIRAGDIKGKVYHKESQLPLEFVNITILRSDSSFIAGTVSDDKGEFILRNVVGENCLLRTSLIGYTTFYKSIVNNDSIVENIAMELSDTQLNEIVITSSKPTFESNSGVIIANVSLSNLKNVGTAVDVIQRMPGVAFEQDNISIFGKGTPIIYINNRQINNQSELDRLLSEDISTVELIKSPGAKYHADGRAVLIIKTKKKQDGLAVLMNDRLMWGTRLGTSGDVSISHVKNAVSTFVSLHHSFKNLRTDDHTVYSIRNNDDIKEHHFHIIDRYPRNGYSMTVGMDWSINANQSVGVQYEYAMTYAPRAAAHSSDVNILNGIVTDSIRTYNLTSDKPRQSLVNVFHRAKLNEKISTQLDFDFLKNNSDRRSHITEFASCDNLDVSLISTSKYKLLAGKLVLEYNSNIGKFEVGSEFNYIKGSGSIVGENIPQENDLYSSKEQTTAMFLNISNIFNGFHIITGLRYEMNYKESIDDVSHQKQVARKFNGLYPNLSISKKINQVQLDFLLSRKVARPSIVQLYNNTAYINQYLIQKGNPFLINSDIYSIELESKYKMLYFSLGYSYEKNPITFYSQPQENSDLIITTVANYDKYQRIDALISLNHKFLFWNLNYSVSLTKPFFSAMYNNESIDHNRPFYSLRAYNDFTLPQNYLLSVNFNYMTDFQYMLINIGHYQRLDLGIRKSFLDNQLKLYLEVWDVFDWMKQNNSTQINSLTLTQNKKRESRFLVFTIGYQINNYKKKYRGSNVSKEQINRF